MKAIQSNNEKVSEIKQENNFIRLIKGSVVAIAITLFGLIIVSLILSYTNISEKACMPIVFILTGISIFIGSNISVRKIKSNGIVNGGAVGLIYILAIYILSSAF